MTGTAGEAAVLGIDLGTTEVKAGLVTLDGRLLGLARAGYRTDTDPASGRAEQDPEAWWGAVTTIVRKLAADAGAEIVAIGLDGHGPTLVAVDDAGRPTRPAIIWSDGRAGAEQTELATFGCLCDQGCDLRRRNPAHVRNALHLIGGRCRRDLRIEPAAGTGDQIDRNRRGIARIGGAQRGDTLVYRVDQRGICRSEIGAA